MAQTKNPSLTIDYAAISDLAAFREQYDQLSGEIQQAKVQLENSPPLEPDAPGAARRDEWRLWLQLQIKSRLRSRDDLVAALCARNIVVEHLPE